MIRSAIETAANGIDGARKAFADLQPGIPGRYGWFVMKGATLLGSFAKGYPEIKELVCCDLTAANVASREALKAALERDFLASGD